MDVSMSRARSGVRQFLSFFFKQCSLYSCHACITRSNCLAWCRSSHSAPIMVSGMSNYPSRKLNGFVVFPINWKSSVPDSI
jgi:hypothetical protein